jgi:GT2 family glycosyltransferase
MVNASTTKVAVVIPNWNGKDELPKCLDSLQAQTVQRRIIVVENGSTDGSGELVTSLYPGITLLPQSKNLGFAGGVNAGIRYALEQDFEYIALLNNDAVADRNWLRELMGTLEHNPKAGIATCKFMTIDKKHLDSTGDIYTTWGLPYPRGRGEPVNEAYDKDTKVFGASGGASLYRASMLLQIGLFDEDFFAYYEDIDISFRAQLAGWKVLYNPRAIAYHQIGATSSKKKGFTTYQTLKNYPWVITKNVPGSYAGSWLACPEGQSGIAVQAADKDW